MPVTKVCIARVPHGILTRNGLDVDSIVDHWLMTEKGRWCNEYADELRTSVNDSWADEGYTVTILADFSREAYITYKLMWMT